MDAANKTEFSTCKEFTDVIREWLTCNFIEFDRPDEQGWTISDDDYPGHIKVRIWDCPTFFHQSGGRPVQLAEKIAATVASIDRIWRAAREAFPNMDLKIEEHDESGGKMVFITFPINENAEK